MTGWNIDVPQTEYYGHLPNRTDWAPGAAEGFQSVLNELAVTPIIAFDTETTGLNVSSDYPLYFSLAWGNRRATLHADLLQYFPGLFADPSKWWVMANAKYDMHMAYMAKRGGVPMGTKIRGKAVDTCVMHSLLYEDKPHGLKYMCQHIGGWSWGDFQDQFGRITKANPPSAIIFRAEQEDFPRLIEYAANDAWGTLLVYNKLREQLERAGTHSLFRSKPPYIETLWDLFYKVEVPYTSALWQMERHGIKVNRSTLEQARPDAERHIDMMERQANALYVKDMGMAINANVNLNSADQLRSWLIDTRGLEPLTMTKGGKTGNRKASVDAKFLQHHADHGDEACKLILEHRSYSKLLGTCLLYTSPSPRDRTRSRMPSSA